MLNPQSRTTNALELIDGSISEYYELIDSALKPSEVNPARYNTTTSPSYQNQCPCVQGSFTTVDIGCADPYVVLLEKSFITPTVDFDITPSVLHSCAGTTPATNPQVYFVGWKRSLDVIYKYEILYNGRPLIDQTYNGEESFVIQIIMKDDVREKRPNQLTNYRNASSMNRDVCGTYFLLANTKAATHISVPVKITLADFPIFTQFCYLQGWMGNWSIRLFPDSRNIITCQVDPKYTVGSAATPNASDYTHEFVQIGDTFKGITNYADNKYTASDLYFTVSNYQFRSCEINLTTQMMYRPVYEQIMAKYMAKPLQIPFLSFNFGRFSQSMKNGQMNSVFSGVVKCCESMFLIPFVDDNHHTICKNPSFKQLYANVGSYGNYPQNPVDTSPNGTNPASYVRFINMTNDALGLEYSPIISMNESLSNSLHAATVPYVLNNKGTLSDTTLSIKSDATDFLIGFPFADEADFQGGLTTQGNVNITVYASGAEFDGPEGTSSIGDDKLAIGPTAIFMCNNVAMIRPSPNGAPAEVVICTDKIR